LFDDVIGGDSAANKFQGGNGDDFLFGEAATTPCSVAPITISSRAAPARIRSTAGSTGTT
jgi:hypothetical protein